MSGNNNLYLVVIRHNTDYAIIGVLLWIRDGSTDSSIIKLFDKMSAYGGTAASSSGLRITITSSFGINCSIYNMSY